MFSACGETCCLVQKLVAQVRNTPTVRVAAITLSQICVGRRNSATPILFPSLLGYIPPESRIGFVVSCTVRGIPKS